MTNNPHKFFYKGADNDFVIFVDDPELYKKYKSGDTTIPLIDIVSVFKVFINRQGGADGILDEASKQDLNNNFKTSNVDEVIKIILDKGSDKHNSDLNDEDASRNDSIGARDTGN
ncbi:hypothetical protein PVL30_003324 [Lodderomyces elongisporus]|uniref:Ribosome maturation protein SDO1/SBDS N-terminal domain-containing protein n=1 Tax=Lodderomyces elongisporus (strain ATCC 11503 / CBS 2605 / JCM 1781 / NBRC 1676 / NRRL YB-4239) TaxID=379508 RepID=A5DYP8_LODEL|nr:uncharacterized protein PVL30_003324 [Lodderomyces elongisporus]EDK44306.1 conserved hypothetical protein [Lodderomyces elongisporus NRRL YB-4239]WLF79569.1 hypothetical protein PVL30_003324 [Lodderomyces elongisporus]